jgi:anti-sigma regulatory factor (Ser/Thr protein kinase)
MQDLSLHILDIVENSIDAGATKIEIVINENIKNNKLTMKIKDNGKGISKKTLKAVVDPFYTTKKTRRVGLGLSMLAQATREADGTFGITSKKSKGTTVTARFVYDHIDRKPLGDIAETIISLVATNGHKVDFIYKHRKNNKSYIFDTNTIKKELDAAPITNLEVLNILRKSMTKELKNIGVII